MEEQMRIEYNKILNEIESYESDITASKNALEDCYLDYMAKKELNDDIAYDNRQIKELRSQLDTLIEIAKQNGIDLSSLVKTR